MAHTSFHQRHPKHNLVSSAKASQTLEFAKISERQNNFQNADGPTHNSFCALNKAIVGPRALPLKALQDHWLLPDLSILPQLSSCASCVFFSFKAWLSSFQGLTSPFSGKKKKKAGKSDSFTSPHCFHALFIPLQNNCWHETNSD